MTTHGYAPADRGRTTARATCAERGGASGCVVNLVGEAERVARPRSRRSRARCLTIFSFFRIYKSAQGGSSGFDLMRSAGGGDA